MGTRVKRILIAYSKKKMRKETKNDKLTKITATIPLTFWSIVGSSGSVLDFSHDQHAVDDPSKHDMFAVQKLALVTRDKELASVGIRARISLVKKQPVIHKSLNRPYYVAISTTVRGESPNLEHW